ncbi:MAG: NUDIX domain-containing protein [archaeon]|nr:NUDIX domain-containing protein [archaeon]
MECVLDGKHKQDKSKEISYASVGIIQDKNNKLLVTRRNKKLRSFPKSWVLPGGRLDEGENFEEALLREIYEETGILIQKGFNSYYYNTIIKCEIEPLFLFESVAPDYSYVPYSQILTVQFSVKINESFDKIKIKCNPDEVDAYIWEDISKLFNIVNNLLYKSKLDGYIYDSISKRYIKYEFSEENLKPPYVNIFDPPFIDIFADEYMLYSGLIGITLLYRKNKQNLK